MLNTSAERGNFVYPDSSAIAVGGLEESLFSYTGKDDDLSCIECRQFLSKDIYIAYNQLSLKDSQNFSLRSNCEAIHMIFILKGSYQARSNGLKVVSLQALEHNMLFLTKGTTVVKVNGSEDLEFVEIQLSIPFVERYISGNHELHRKISFALPDTLSKRNMPVNPQLQGVLFDLIRCELEGNLKSLYVRAKVIELLSLQLSQFNSSDWINDTGLNSREIEKMNVVKDLIAASPEKAYSMAYLARMAGTNEQYLKTHFKKIHGKTVFNYLTGCRMELAKDLLLRGDKKIGEIAFEVGYRHSTHFTQAFKKHFGYLPHKVRAII